MEGQAGEQPLDLSEHSPEEYEGKSLEIYGTRYIVGRLLGHGEEKLVYSLLNAESKLSLHVLRIRRAHGTPWRELDITYWMERQFAGSQEVPFLPFMDVPYPGFWVDIQESPSFADLSGRGTERVMGQIRSRLDTGTASGILYKINEVLADNGVHTEALMAKAEFYKQRPDGVKLATSLALRAVEIEPNFLPYLVKATGFAIESLDYEGAAATHRLIKQKYDYHTGTDMAMVLMHLRFGDPSAAAAIRERFPIEDTHTDPVAVEGLDKTISSALENSLTCSRLGAEAYTHLGDINRKDGYGRCLEILENAVSVYPENQRMRANLGLIMALSGRPVEGADLLIRTAAALPMPWKISCAVSAAYAYLQAGDIGLAVQAHESAMVYLGSQVDLGSLDAEHFPRHARWIPLVGAPLNAGTVADAATIVEAALAASGEAGGDAYSYFAAILEFFQGHLAEQEADAVQWFSEHGPGERVSNP